MLSSKNDMSIKEDHRYEEWIPKNKTAAFKTLFNRVKDAVGGYEKAIKVSGISDCVIGNLNKRKLSQTSAKKIMRAYKKYCNT